MFWPIFLAYTKIIFEYNFEASASPFHGPKNIIAFLYAFHDM